ncbi:hypothetical protein [Methanolobus sp. WCC4]|uniref:hypothetical protein n=1 Tax=Methanolobus sp. WCC4 TaxID=3125784 RepID=UPI0030FAE87C
MSGVLNESIVDSIDNNTDSANNSSILQPDTSESQGNIENSNFWTENTINMATFLTSIVSLFTLYELRKQRNLSSTPNIHAISEKMVVEATSTPLGSFDGELVLDLKCNLFKIPEYEFIPIYKIPLKIINTGSSPAIDVKITWNYDYETLKKTASDFNKLRPNFKCRLARKFIDISSIDGKYNSTYLTEYNFSELGYLLPFSSEHEEITVNMPRIISVYLILNLNAITKSNLDQDIIIHPLDIVIEYYDNLNIFHKENYIMKFNPMLVTSNIIKGKNGENIENFNNIKFLIELQKVKKSKIWKKKIEQVFNIN